MRRPPRNTRDYQTPPPRLFAHAGANLRLVVMMVMLNGVTTSVAAQRAVDAQGSHVGQAASPTTMSQSSVQNSSQDEYADFKLSHPVQELAHWAGLQPITTFHLCWDFNFFLMLTLIVWKGGPFLAEALQKRSRSIRLAIEEAQRFVDEATMRLAQIEKRWAQLDSEIAVMRAVAEAEMNYEAQRLSTRTTEDIRRIMEYSQSEIENAAQRARRELKVFAADLAISLARGSIQINKRKDEQLVQNFIQELGHQEVALRSAQSPAQSNRELVGASMHL